MKKLFLMIATVALMASCTGNGTTSGSASGEQKDSTTAENTEEVKEKKDTIKGPATIDNPVWSFDVAEGWLVESEHSGDSQKSSTYLRIKPVQKPEGVFGIVSIKITSYPYESNTVEDAQKTIKNVYDDIKEAGNVTINGVKFAKLFRPEGDKGSALTHLCAPLTPKGNVALEIDGYEIDDPAIKDMINSFKLKPAEAEQK